MPSSECVVQTLYSNHHGWLNTWLRSRPGNAADAADLAQDTFVRLLQKTERFELKAPRAFLRTIARGLVIDHWRREEIERAYLESIAHLPEAQVPSAEHRALVLELLEGIARLLEGLTYKKIVAQMNVSLRSVERYHCYVLRYEP
jgi:RNA polymerase sigma factor (sigma-70 family)